MCAGQQPASAQPARNGAGAAEERFPHHGPRKGGVRPAHPGAAGAGGTDHCHHELNVRQAEALCKKLAKPPKEPVEPAPRGTLPVEVEESLKQALGSEVNVAYHDGKGKLTVHFYSDEQLKAFANLLGQYQVED